MVVIPIVVLAALLGQQPETMSLLNEPLYAPSVPKAERAQAEATLAATRAAYQKAPNDPAAILAYEQAVLTFGRVGDALEILTHGLEANHDDPRLLLERGRNYIRIRKFVPAQRDLHKAAESLPAAKCALAFAQYVTADFKSARETYATCPDPGIFAYVADRRAGLTPSSKPVPSGPPPSAGAPIHLPGTVARQKADAQLPIVADYMEAVELLAAGDQQKATERLKQIVEKNRKNDWMEPAYIAAEADYARLYKPERKKKKKKD
jgi:tetratricopeptide (TPR) repeat protein